MQSNLIHRRTQFSSCDECRRSKLSCDADRNRRQPSAETFAITGCCTRCFDRRLRCTFEWMRDSNRNNTSARIGSNGKSRAKHTRSSTRRATPMADTSSPASDHCSLVSIRPNLDPIHAENYEQKCTGCRLTQTSFPIPAQDPVNSSEFPWLRVIYESAFEMVFGSWMGKYCNPFGFGERSLSEASVSISRVCRQLDNLMDKDDSSPAAMLSPGPGDKHETNFEIDQSLDRAIESYAARWLPLTPQRVIFPLSSVELIRNLWRSARRDMLKVINRPSYRSILSLFLFALTPIPVGIAAQEELDGVSAHVCLHAALQQIQSLRARQKSLQFNGARVTLNRPSPTTNISPNSFAEATFINAESTAYWAALTFDTSASLTLSCRPLLSSGLFGFDSESAWRMVRSCTEVFRELTKDWNKSSFEMNDEKANLITASANAWKLLLWKLTANFKEAIRDGHDECEVERAFHAVLNAIDRFDVTYRDWMDLVQKRIQFLSQETKLSWYEVMMHYHLPILMLVDILIVSERHDLLSQFPAQRTEAESAVLNTLIFGLNNKYSLHLPFGHSNHDQQVEDSRTRHSENSVSVPLVAIDPYPHHVVAAVRLLQQKIDRDFAAGEISTDIYRHLSSHLAEAAQNLPSSSQAVQIVRAEFSAQQMMYE